VDYTEVVERRKARVHAKMLLQGLPGIVTTGKRTKRKPPPTLEEIVLKHIRRMRKV